MVSRKTPQGHRKKEKKEGDGNLLFPKPAKIRSRYLLCEEWVKEQKEKLAYQCMPYLCIFCPNFILLRPQKARNNQTTREKTGCSLLAQCGQDPFGDPAPFHAPWEEPPCSHSWFSIHYHLFFLACVNCTYTAKTQCIRMKRSCTILVHFEPWGQCRLGGLAC